MTPVSLYLKSNLPILVLIYRKRTPYVGVQPFGHQHGLNEEDLPLLLD